MAERLSPVLMVQGTSSAVGKSLLVTGLCRLFRQDGWDVAPFKAQNMALNSYVTPEGHEIGRAQAVQAEAAGLAPHVDMNPILLKPESGGRSQVVLGGRPWMRQPAGTFYQHRDELWRAVTAALDRLRSRHDLVIAEGAGSPAEINLRPGDLANMEVALYARAPVLLVGDIDRGGVFAQLIGTLILLAPEERALVRGLVINKFRGDLALLGDGLRMLEAHAGVPVLGVIPYLRDLGIAEEDSVCLDEPAAAPHAEWQIDIAAIRFPHLSNFDDLDALRLEPGVAVRFVSSPAALGRPRAIILPGSKNTLADLAWLREQGLDRAILERATEGTAVVGLCGGYQMLGRTLRDPCGADGGPPGGETPGLGLLPVDTVFRTEKHTWQASGRVCARAGWLAGLAGCEVSGYEVHMGESAGGEPLLEIARCGLEGKALPDGAVSEDGRVFGTYLHGLFDTPGFRCAWLRSLGWQGAESGVSLRQAREAAYDRLAGVLRECLDVAGLYRLIGADRPRAMHTSAAR